MDKYDATLAFLISAAAICIAYNLGYSRCLREFKDKVDSLYAATAKARESREEGRSNG